MRPHQTKFVADDLQGENEVGGRGKHTAADLWATNIIVIFLATIMICTCHEQSTLVHLCAPAVDVVVLHPQEGVLGSRDVQGWKLYIGIVSRRNHQ